MITQEALKSVLHYDENDGSFTWLRSAGTRAVRGKEAGSIRDGYIIITIDSVSYRAHRLAFLYMGEEVPKEVDHINHCRYDNRWENLRAVTRQENMQNCPMRSTNTSGHTGVNQRESGNWQASIRVNGKSKSLGTFPVLEDAIIARKEGERLHGFHLNHE